jgi:hypothetical protein
MRTVFSGQPSVQAVLAALSMAASSSFPPNTLFTASVVPQAYLYLPLVLMPCFSHLCTFATMVPKGQIPFLPLVHMPHFFHLSTFATVVPKGHIPLLPLVISRLPPRPECFQFSIHGSFSLLLPSWLIL